MNIVQKINDVKQKILDGDITLGNDIAKHGIEAIFAGIGSDKWRILMDHFANNQGELDRLCGKEADFNKSRWGVACLAYIAGNATCTAQTAMDGGTVRGMSTPMLKNLDAEGQESKILENEATSMAFTKAAEGLEQ